MRKPAWTWRHAILESELPPTTRHVLLTISCFMNDVGEGCYRTTRDLARFSGLSERAVCQHIQSAVQSGWLKKAQHGFRGQKWKRQEYEPRWPKGADARSAPFEKALTVVPKGTDPDDIKVLTEGQQDKNISDYFSLPSQRASSAASPPAPSNGPKLDGGYFRITPELDEWRAWVDHYRSVRNPEIIARQEAKGFFLTRTRWPAEGRHNGIKSGPNSHP